LLSFFAPWCGHCQRLAPEWEKAATNLKGIVPLGKVDCTVHQNLCGQYEVKGYPTIKLISEKGKKVVDYQQARQASSIVRFGTDSLPDNVQRIKDTSALTKFLENSIPKLLIFSTKTDVSPILKSLSVHFKGRVVFGQVPQSASEIVQKYSISSFPKILIISGDEPTEYTGSINGIEIKNFINGFVGEQVTETPAPPSAPKPKPKPKIVETYAEVTSENLDNTCSGLCIVGFIDVENSENEKSIVADQKSILFDILENFTKDGKFKFVYVDRNNNPDLISKFSIKEPTVLVYNGKKQRYVKADEFKFKPIFSTIEHVLTGDAQYTKL